MPAYRDKRDGRWRYRKWIKTPNGGRIRITGTPSTDTKIAAEAAERAHIDRIHHPERFATIPAAVVPKRKEIPTFKEYAATFMRGYLPGQKPAERKSKNQILDTHLIPFFGHMRLDEILQHDVDAFTTAELKRCARKTVNNRLAVLSTLLAYAHDNQVIGKPTLRCHVKGPKAEDAPIIAVAVDDVRQLVRFADPVYRAAILLASEAGLRIGEIRGAQWGDIRGDEITIRRAIDTDGNVGAPKHDRVRKVPLSPALVAELAKLPKLGLWIVSAADGTPLEYRAMLDELHRVYLRAGVKVPVSEQGQTMPWHSLRHTFGTECAARGVPIPTLRDLMGHTDVKTTLRYVTVTSDDRRNAIRRAFGQPVGNEVGVNVENS
ncbi:MAG: tyrosine-type recombinase/integrase [Kofleriaceae bacterium]